MRKKIPMQKKIRLLITALLLLSGAIAQQQQTDSLKALLAASQPAKERVELLLTISDQYRFSAPDSSMAYALLARNLARQSGNNIQEARANLNVGGYYYATGKSDSGLLLANEYINRHKETPEQPSLLAQYYSFSGLCLMKLDRKRDAMERFYEALRIAEKIGDQSTQIKAQANMGWVMMELNQPADAIQRFRDAVVLIQTTQTSLRNLGTLYNNMASCFGTLELLDSARKYADLGIQSAQQNNDLNAQANGHFILGTALEKMGRLEDALKSYEKAQPLREKVGDPYFLVSDMAVKASLLARMGRAEEGIQTSRAALEIAGKNQLNAKLPMIYESLAANFQAVGDYKNAALTYQRLADLKDSLYSDALPKALAEMSTKYESEKKEQQILLQRSELSRKNLLITGIVLLVLLAAFLLYSFYRRHQLKQKAALQAEIMHQQELATRAVLEAEERERQRIAKDLHDGVGQIMSAAKMNLSAFENEIPFNSPEQRQKFEKIIYLVDESCKEVRTVSHNMMPNALLKSGLASAIREFTDKIDDRMLKVDLYSEGLNERLDTNVETVLYRVIQECVNNVIKHASANHLDISLIKDADGISATVEDNGRGFDTADSSKYDGLGLKNIRSRIEYLKGTVEYNSNPGKGTLVAIHVPAPV